jgi:hypothetical protein
MSWCVSLELGGNIKGPDRGADGELYFKRGNNAFGYHLGTGCRPAKRKF